MTLTSPSQTLAGLSPDSLKRLSNRLSESESQLEQRTSALNSYYNQPLEKSVLYKKYTDMLTGLKLDTISPGLPSGNVSVPKEIQHLIGDDSNQTVAVQVDSEMVRVDAHGQLEREGLIFTDIKTALREHHDLLADYFGKILRPEDDKFAALNAALYTSGIFLFVPKGLKVNIPIRSLTLVKTLGIGAFARNLIVAEENSKITFLQEAYSNINEGHDLPQNAQSLLSEVTEACVGEEAELNFASIQNLEDNVHYLVNRRSSSQKDSRINWTVGHIGGGITRSRMDSALDGPGANAEDVEVVFGGGAQMFDIVTDLTHQAPSTTGSVLARGVLRDKSRLVFKGMIRIEKGAKNSRSYLAEHAMILSKNARADAIPGLEIETNEVKATHSGSVAQIDEEQVFYLTSRALSDSEAKKLIIVGFLHPAVQRIPSRTVRAGIQYLIEEKWVGRRVQLPPKMELLPELEEEPEDRTTTDLFERHYKYR